MNQNWWILLIIFVIVVILLVLWWRSGQIDDHHHHPHHLTEEQNEQLMTFARLWDKQAFLTREYIIAISAKQGGLCAGQVADRLSNASDDIGTIFGSFADHAAGEKLAELLNLKNKSLENIVVLLKNGQSIEAEIEAAHDTNKQIAEHIASKVEGIKKEALLVHLDSLFAKTVEETKAIVNGQCMNSLTMFETDVLDAVSSTVGDLMHPLTQHLRKH